ncbi:hypothetical protein GOBAR_DD25834 [Gossypium barbadense]|nr:hypothetical protein GOBAR_DD25834 [Gossypium barbadense]
MSSAVIAGASSSCSAAFTSRKNCSNKTTSTPSPKAFNTSQKTALQGLSLQEAKRGVSDFFIAEKKSSVCSSHARRGLEITARTAGASKTIEVEVDKPLGLTLGQKQGGGVVITAVDGGGNAAKAGLKAGDQVLYTSSFFGDELWPADKLGFTKTAIQAKPDSVYFVVSSLAQPIHVATLKKWYLAELEFEFQHFQLLSSKGFFHNQKDAMWLYPPDTYGCPQCQAPKKRFAPYDVNTGKAIGGGLPPIGVIIGLLAGVGAVGALLVYGLQ